MCRERREQALCEVCYYPRFQIANGHLTRHSLWIEGATVSVTGQLWELNAPWKLLALICISKPAQQKSLGGGPRPSLLLPAREGPPQEGGPGTPISDPASLSPLLRLPSSAPQPPTKSFLPHIQNSKTLPQVPSGSEL